LFFGDTSTKKFVTECSGIRTRRVPGILLAVIIPFAIQRSTVLVLIPSLEATSLLSMNLGNVLLITFFILL
jgi:hypothetical protein